MYKIVCARGACYWYDNNDDDDVHNDDDFLNDVSDNAICQNSTARQRQRSFT